jgi:hypothetical protein
VRNVREAYAITERHASWLLFQWRGTQRYTPLLRSGEDALTRAIIATLTYSFARITAALRMRVEDLRLRGSGWELRLREKGGNQHVISCHHALAETLHAYIAAAGIGGESKGWLFRGVFGEWRNARTRPGDGRARKPPHHQTL